MFLAVPTPCADPGRARPVHPLLLSGAPLCCEVDFIEVKSQRYPLLALCVLERAALRAGMVLRLETCPQELGASWLSIEGIGRIFVERVDGLVRVNLSVGDGDGHLRIGDESGISALIDTGAQVCLIGGHARVRTDRRRPYTGPTLRGADDSVVACLSTLTFTLHFCASAMQRAAAAGMFSAESYACAVVAGLGVQSAGGAPADGRTSHRAKLTTAQTVHSRFGVTDPNVFRALATAAVGVALSDKDCGKYMSLAYAQQASQRTAIRHAAMPRADPRPGEYASMDLTRTFERDVDGNVCGVILLDVASFLMWACPLKGKSGREVARAVGLYREHVRTIFGTELQHLRSDSDPSFAVSGHGDAYTASALRNSLAASPPAVLLTFSPPYCQAMNPVENAVRHAYYLMNFFMAQAYLTMLAWSDMLLAAVAALNCLPRPQSRNELLRVKSPHKIATGVKPDLSTHIAAPGQLVVVHHAGAKASGCVPTAALCYYVKPSGAGSLVRDVRSWRCFVSYHVRPVRHEIDGIAAQAVAVSHALTSGNMRDGVGLRRPRWRPACALYRLNAHCGGGPRGPLRCWTR